MTKTIIRLICAIFVKPLGAQEICKLPQMLPDGTDCEDLGQTSSRWYYDPQTQLCKEFGYSHCSGTPNNFLSKSSCELFCGAKTLSQEGE